MKRFKIFLRVFCTVIIRCTETFWSPCTSLPFPSSAYPAFSSQSATQTDRQAQQGLDNETGRLTEWPPVVTLRWILSSATLYPAELMQQAPVKFESLGSKLHGVISQDTTTWQPEVSQHAVCIRSRSSNNSELRHKILSLAVPSGWRKFRVKLWCPWCARELYLTQTYKRPQPFYMSVGMNIGIILFCINAHDIILNNMSGPYKFQSAHPVRNNI
jgi:hypothetical protein